jgi:uncharacterized membrane protein YjgN (DUF898 family)
MIQEPPSLNTSNGLPARIQFTGSGSEYFRIWTVNLLLTYLTLGIYSAWAKVRREKYFHQNTVIAGHSLDYHGNPFAILKGRIVGFGLLALYTGSSAVPAISVIAIILIALAMPFFMQRSVRFRFSNSSYRGLRFGFAGTAKEAYRTLLPFLFVPLLLASIVLTMAFYPELTMQLWRAMSRGATYAAGAGLFLLGIGFIAFYALLHATWRRFSINQAYFGSAQAKTSITGKRYVWIYLTSILLLIVIIGAIVATVVVFAWQSAAASATSIGLPSLSALQISTITSSTMAFSPMFFAALPLLLLAFYLIFSIVQGVLVARLQNYCWNQGTDMRSSAGEQIAWFTSDLSLTSYGLLQLKNWVLTLITLGLYRPFAIISATKAKLQAISLSDSEFIDSVLSVASDSASAIGEEALDAFDLDFSI